MTGEHTHDLDPVVSVAVGEYTLLTVAGFGVHGKLDEGESGNEALLEVGGILVPRALFVTEFFFGFLVNVVEVVGDDDTIGGFPLEKFSESLIVERHFFVLLLETGDEKKMRGIFNNT